MPRADEVNFDGIVGPTHNYSGLAYGNLASLKHRLVTSHPRQAALEGLAKMKFMMDLGLRQAVLPPHERPHLATLRRLGFSGSDADVLAKALKEDPVLLASVASASSMWAANAATVSPSGDTRDARVHFSAANLISNFHRSIEASFTAAVLRAIFEDEKFFAHHAPLPAAVALADEGAANHTRLCREYGEAGIEIFTYGRTAFAPRDKAPRKFPARQTFEASSAIARAHGLAESRAIFVRQSPKAIDAGVFHNDVVAVGNRNVLFYHEHAFADSAEMTKAIAREYRAVSRDRLRLIKVEQRTIPLKVAVATYLFNSQLVSPRVDSARSLTAGSGMTLVAPIECQENVTVRRYLERLVRRASSPITQVRYVNVRQSMHNGGGPACLRLRVVLTEGQILRAHAGVFLTDALHERLVQWVQRHYREELGPQDLADPRLIEESRAALDELTRILRLGSIYDFQRDPTTAARPGS